MATKTSLDVHPVTPVASMISEPLALERLGFCPHEQGLTRQLVGAEA